MNSIQNFAFEETLVRVCEHGGSPWFVGRDVCQALHIRNENDAMSSLDDDERVSGVAITDPSGTKYAVIISEPGVYRLVFRSRKPEAERFKRWLAHDVLPTLRRTGRYEAEPQPEALSLAGDTRTPPPVRDILAEPLLHRLQIIREARCIHGRDVARVMWAKLGLPAVPPPPRTALDEARELLRHLLDTPTPDGRIARTLIALALDDGETERGVLLGCGIRVYPETDTFVIANHSAWITEALRGTDWATPLAHVAILRRLSGASPSGPVRMGQMQPRGTRFAASAIDEFVP